MAHMTKPHIKTIRLNISIFPFILKPLNEKCDGGYEFQLFLNIS